MRKSMIAALMAMTICASADDEAKWMLADSNGNTVNIEEIGFIIVADNEEAFSVVRTDGTTLAGIRTASFRKGGQASIDQATGAAQQTAVELAASGRLHISGCGDNTKVTLMTTDGRLLLDTTAHGGKCDIDISRMENGIYIIKAGKTAVKFLKK